MKAERKLKKWPLNLLAVSAILGVVACGNVEIAGTHAIQQGPFQASILETGELQAVNAYSMIAPDVRRYGRTMRITELVENGQKIKKGDLVVQFDPSGVINFIVEQETRLEVEVANMNKMLAEHESRKKRLDAELQTALANFEMKKLELEKFQFESEKKKEIKKLEYQQSEIQLNNLKEKIELDKNVIKNDLKIQNIKMAQRKDNIAQGKMAIDQLSMYSDHNGIAQIGTNWRNGQLIRLGDEVWRGMPIVFIPDISEMKVIAKVNENDISKIQLGQKVVIRLDAYPKIPFEGAVKDIGKLSYPKDKNSNIKVFDVEIFIEGSDPALKPGMTVSCEFIYADIEDTYYVANECIEKNGNGYFIYKKTGAGYEQQMVKVGPRNNLHTVLLGSYQPGAKLIPIAQINSQTNI
jgi:HlyD family secretion protein